MPDEQQKIEALFSLVKQKAKDKLTLSNSEQKFADNHVRCVCSNVIHINNAYCSFCHRFNAATNQSQCPTCGQDIQSVKEPAEPAE